MNSALNRKAVILLNNFYNIAYNSCDALNSDYFNFDGMPY